MVGRASRAWRRCTAPERPSSNSSRRYGPAIYKYLRGSLRDQTAADEMYQEFALRFLQGAYASADPSRGRFRNFLRTILVRLVTEYHRKKAGDRLIQLPELREPVDERECSPSSLLRFGATSCSNDRGRRSPNLMHIGKAAAPGDGPTRCTP